MIQATEHLQTVGLFTERFAEIFRKTMTSALDQGLTYQGIETVLDTCGGFVAAVSNPSFVFRANIWEKGRESKKGGQIAFDMELPLLYELLSMHGFGIDKIVPHAEPYYPVEYDFPEEVKRPIRKMIEDIESAWQKERSVNVTDIALIYDRQGLCIGGTTDEAIVARFEVQSAKTHFGVRFCYPVQTLSSFLNN